MIDVPSFFEPVEGELPARLKSHRLPLFLQYWRSLAGADVPRRADIDPARIKPLLPFMMVVDLSDEPLQVRYRLVGTEVVNFTGLDFTGRNLDELEFDEFDLENLLAAYRRVRDTRRPGAGCATYSEHGHLVIETEYLICPLRGETGRIDKCAVIEDYFLGGRLSVNNIPPGRLRT